MAGSPSFMLKPGSERAASEWDDFAHADAYTYIMTDLPRGDREAFWGSGEATVSRELIPVVRQHSVPQGIALEIGCGVGRLIFPMAERFERVFGLDVAPEMARQGTVLAAEKRAHNARFFTFGEYEVCPGDFAELDGTVDFVYSLIVFQHIADFRFITLYLGLVKRWLSDQGIAYLQFDTRPRGIAYRVKTALPDFLLPRFLRRGIRRIRRTPGELETAFAHSGLEMVGDQGAKTEDHRYILRKRG